MDAGPASESYNPLGILNLELAKVWLGSAEGEASRYTSLDIHHIFFPSHLAETQETLCSGDKAGS